MHRFCRIQNWCYQTISAWRCANRLQQHRWMHLHVAGSRGSSVAQGTSCQTNARRIPTEMCLQTPRSVSELSCSTDVDDILQIVYAFSMSRRRHGMLLRELQGGIQKNVSDWPCEALANIVSDWRRLGYLREDFLLAVSADFQTRTSELCLSSAILLFDGFAARRFYVRNTIDKLMSQISLLLPDAPNHRLCEVASCCARLERMPESIVQELSKRFSCAVDANIDEYDLTARDVAMLAYSMQKLNLMSESSFECISKLSRGVHQNFVAAELAIFAVVAARCSFRSVAMFDMLCNDAFERVSQFSSMHTALLLRSLAVVDFPVAVHPLARRLIVQLPRIVLSAPRADTCIVVAALQQLFVRSRILDSISVHHYGSQFLTDAEKISITRSVLRMTPGDTNDVCQKALTAIGSVTPLPTMHFIGLHGRFCRMDPDVNNLSFRASTTVI